MSCAVAEIEGDYVIRLVLSMVEGHPWMDFHSSGQRRALSGTGRLVVPSMAEPALVELVSPNGWEFTTREVT